ncbi:MAG: hypothetical protein H7Y30_02400, partial [Pyrinomonadaceae bacterium]|nr:hypothetical protein [Pyrinomonadaceae bacterium]
QTPALVIEPGAVFEGSCRMQVKEAVDNKPKEKAKETQQTLVAPTSELLQMSDISEVAS